jgi:hypothetical protein
MTTECENKFHRHVSENGMCPRLQEEPSMLGSIGKDREALFLGPS